MSRPAKRYQIFFAELKRRQVFRIIAVYGAVAFAVMQAADIAFPRLGLPDWTVTFVVALSVIGFPIAAVLAWALELTPEGVKVTDAATSDELEAMVAEPARRRWPAGVLALVGVALLVAGGWWVFRDGGARGADLTAPERSIAVLPFANMSDEPANETSATESPTTSSSTCRRSPTSRSSRARRRCATRRATRTCARSPGSWA